MCEVGCTVLCCADNVSKRATVCFCTTQVRAGHLCAIVCPTGVQGILQLLWSLCYFNARPAQPWFDAVYSALAARAPEWSPPDLAAVANYLARYMHQHAPPAMCDLIASFLVREGVAEQMGADGVASCLYLLAISGYVPDAAWLEAQATFLEGAMDQVSHAGLETVAVALPLLGPEAPRAQQVRRPCMCHGRCE